MISNMDDFTEASKAEKLAQPGSVSNWLARLAPHEA